MYSTYIVWHVKHVVGVMSVAIFLLAYFWKLKLWVLLLQDDSMHPIHRSILYTSWEELLALHCTCNNVTHKGVFLWQICSEVHLLPLELLSDTQSWETKVRSDGLTFNEIEEAV